MTIDNLCEGEEIASSILIHFHAERRKKISHPLRTAAANHAQDPWIVSTITCCCCHFLLTGIKKRKRFLEFFILQLFFVDVFVEIMREAKGATAGHHTYTHTTHHTPHTSHNCEMAGPPPSQTSKFIRKAGEAALGAIPPVAIAWWLDTLNQQRSEQREAEAERRRYLDDLLERHEDYSKCMATLFRYKRQHGEKYGEHFIKALNENKDEVAEINECRSKTKDYWRKIRAYCHATGACSEDDPNVADWKSQHSRFRQISAIDRAMEDYQESDGHLFEWRHIIQSKERPSHS